MRIWPAGEIASDGVCDASIVPSDLARVNPPPAGRPAAWAVQEPLTVHDCHASP